MRSATISAELRRAGDRRSIMDHPLLFLPPRPPLFPAADIDLLELDVLWPTSAAPDLLAALPNEGSKNKKKLGGPTYRSDARPFPEITAASPASAMARSAPVRIPRAAGARKVRWVQAGGSCGDHDGGEAVVPPHEIVARRAAACSSVLEGAGRTLKGR